MKILICNLALRSKPETFPPVACTTLCNALIKSGYNAVFYDMDVKRPTFEEMGTYFKKEQFDIVGISAIVSTGYLYAKKLSNVIKSASPKTSIILGGNLAAAYDVILRKCPIDLCVAGEGELVIVNLAMHWEKYNNFSPDNDDLPKIRGIVYLDKDGRTKFTSYERPIPSEEIAQPDYDFLEKYSKIDNYILDPLTRYDFAYDVRSYDSKRKGKKMATIFTSKGCINKCTFCHRWIAGYRIIPVDRIVETMQNLIDKYNVGFFCISDECFGESPKWIEEFIIKIKPLDILFQIGGLRVSVIKNDPTVIERLKNVGLTALYFGMESGSDKILNIMGKNADRSENLKAAKLCAQAGVYTNIQLVIGMPGENEDTINDTIDFVKSATEILPFPSLASINYLQSLPGAPTYKFLRQSGFLGSTIDDEEQYLISISDLNASDFRQYRNVSEMPLSNVKIWKFKILIIPIINWFKKNDWKLKTTHKEEFRDDPVASATIDAHLIHFTNNKIILYKIIDIMGGLFWMIMLFGARYKIYGVWKAILFTLDIEKEEKIKV